MNKTIIWIFVYLLCIYINGGDEFFTSTEGFGNRFILPVLCGTLIFSAVCLGYRIGIKANPSWQAPDWMPSIKKLAILVIGLFIITMAVGLPLNP